METCTIAIWYNVGMIREQISAIARSLLDSEIAPAPRYRLLRDVLHLPGDDPRMVRAKREVLGTRRVADIAATQHTDGSWGYFHSLSSSAKGAMTTEQALRRLLVLGLDPSDDPIRKAVGYLEQVLAGQAATPDRVEKIHRWDIYMPLMLAAWLHYLSPGHREALTVARNWAKIIGHSFSGGRYDQDRYLAAYREVFSDTPHPKAGRLRDFVHFYPLRLLRGMLPPETEEKMLAHVIGHHAGIYYVYEGPITDPPADFCSRQAGRYMGALELLTEYPRATQMLAFAADWLMAHRDADGGWDMGPAAKDGVHLPLSDSWRNQDARRTDSTVRILTLLRRFSSRS